MLWAPLSAGTTLGLCLPTPRGQPPAATSLQPQCWLQPPAQVKPRCRLGGAPLWAGGCAVLCCARGRFGQMGSQAAMGSPGWDLLRNEPPVPWSAAFGASSPAGLGEGAAAASPPLPRSATGQGRLRPWELDTDCPADGATRRGHIARAMARSRVPSAPSRLLGAHRPPPLRCPPDAPQPGETAAGRARSWGGGEGAGPPTLSRHPEHRPRARLAGEPASPSVVPGCGCRTHRAISVTGPGRHPRSPSQPPSLRPPGPVRGESALGARGRAGAGEAGPRGCVGGAKPRPPGPHGAPLPPGGAAGSVAGPGMGSGRPGSGAQGRDAMGLFTGQRPKRSPRSGADGPAGSGAPRGKRPSRPAPGAARNPLKGRGRRAQRGGPSRRSRR